MRYFTWKLEFVSYHIFCPWLYFQFLAWKFLELHHLFVLWFYLALIYYCCYLHHYNHLVNILLTRWSRFSFGHCLKTRPRPGLWTWEKNDSLKNGPIRKTGPQRPKTLPLVSCYMKENVEVIHFYVHAGVCKASFSRK